VTVTLEDKYTLRDGRIYLNGTHALVRLALLQRERDIAAGLNTAGFISGYRGSPLGIFDQQLEKAEKHLRSHHIHFEPGLNEDLAATAVWGSQQVNLFPGAKYDGVFSMWYGKAPGVDRTGDALRHANSAGTSRHGGVLMLLGDDHNCKSSTLPSHSETAMIHASVPVLNPAGVGDLLDFGLLGWGLSRYSGSWVALKCLIDTMDSSISMDVDPRRAVPVNPTDHALPPGGLSIRLPDPPLDQERRQMEHRLPAIFAFARANKLDRTIFNGGARRRLGIVATGKSYQDTRQAFALLGLDEAKLSALGIALYKVGMNWPLETSGARAFADGLETLMVVEEKRALIEEQLARALYDLPDNRRPRLIGKVDENGRSLFGVAGELSATQIALAIDARVRAFDGGVVIAEAADRLRRANEPLPDIAKRTPFFCSGCPHNRSTQVPDGTHALAGIGCHYMVHAMERNTTSFTQMGGEGTSWVGMAPFTTMPHVFVNIGDGTYAHSGSLAIRQSVAAGVNATYKLLFNDAVAMTGGQVAEGGFTVPQIAAQLRAEGVQTIHVLTEDVDRYNIAQMPPGVAVSPREDLAQVQTLLRVTPGVSVIIYDQTCAAEKRRRRKRGSMPKPDVRAYIHPTVCEGCGDCGVKSNCVSIQPLETEFGRKRQIDQSSCNVDLSCVEGFCPSFVKVQGTLKKTQRPAETGDALPHPALPKLDCPYSILISGVGGTGVVTVGAIIGMAAHLEGRGALVLDMIGLSQKGGQVLTQLRLAPKPDEIHSARLGAGQADVLIACDLIVAAGNDTLSFADRARTHCVLNDHLVAPAEFTRKPDLVIDTSEYLDRVRERTADTFTVDATAQSLETVGDAVGANIFLLGVAWQRGLIPLTAEAIEEAIELNDNAVALNKRAFREGRRAAVARKKPVAPAAETLEAFVTRRTAFLVSYQDKTYADRYAAVVSRAAAAEKSRMPGHDAFARAVAGGLFKLMAYKDEYEVARLYAETDFLEDLAARYEGIPRISFQLAPPTIGERKRSFGPWLLPFLRVLAKLKFLRGSAFDVFGWHADRKQERELIAEFENLVEHLAAKLSPAAHTKIVEALRTTEQMRGFGHVKRRNIAEARTKRSELLSQIDGTRVAVPTE
jgi:indolepyruvate ferredoxin oxidoreductase